MAFVGMDVDAVEGVGRSLQSQAEQLEQLVARIDSLVSRLPGVWEGRDSTAFVSEWWPRHKSELRSAGDAVRGLGDSALANASEQRSASGAGSVGPGSSVPGHGAGELPDLRSLLGRYQDSTVPGFGWKVSDLVGLTPLGTAQDGLLAVDGLTSGDPAQVVNGLATVTSDVLKGLGPVGFAGGAAIQSVQWLADEVVHTDWSTWSPEGAASNFRWIAENPSDALGSIGESLISCVPKIAGIFKP